jgi:hypothetical protein
MLLAGSRRYVSRNTIGLYSDADIQLLLYKIINTGLSSVDGAYLFDPVESIQST